MARGRIGWAGIVASALALSAMAAPAQAQFGGLLGGGSKSKTSDGCAEGKSRSSGSRIAGGILGGIAGSVAGRAGGVFNFVPVAGLTDTLTAAIACKLDPEEQKKAAEATLEATRGAGEEGEAEVGAMSAWTSETRDDVSGTSTVVARDDNARGGVQCITVSDVIIVQGEETKADKRMCRQPPAKRYALA
jgi:hypothetical protein